MQIHSMHDRVHTTKQGAASGSWPDTILGEKTVKTQSFPRPNLGIIAAAMIMGLSSVAQPAGATAVSANLSVSASVAQKCTIGTGSLGFGAYDPIATNLTANVDQSTTMTVTCTKGASGITMGLGSSAAAGTGCTAPQRCLASGTDYLNYQLYSDSGRTAVWTGAISEAVIGGVTTPTAVTIYGRIPGAQDAAVGATYADTIVATVNY
jgi:spore coat protein U-like protein